MVNIIKSAVILAIAATSADAFSPSSFTSRNGLLTTPSTSTLSMKIYDWKRRGDASTTATLNDVENTVFTLDNLTSSPGSRKRKNRVGRGIAAGQGHQCGAGMRGQHSRKGRSVRPGFEGGQIPLYRRLPKFPGQPMGPGHTRTVYNLIKLEELNDVAAGATCNFDSLFESKAITKTNLSIHKVVSGRDAFTAKDITVQAHAFSASARAAIEANGGKCQILKKTTDEVIEG